MIEISGIPCKDDKNCEEILLNLLQKVGVDLAESDLEAVFLANRMPLSLLRLFKRKETGVHDQGMKIQSKKGSYFRHGYKLITNANVLSKGKIYIHDSLTG